MEKHIEILDSLMKAKKEKKKKEPTIKEKEAFRNAWISLVDEVGFNDRAEQFLYDGFTFCGAEPFYAYLIQTEDKNSTLAKLFSGNYYGKDNNVTFRIVTHLLVLMLNDNAPVNLLTPMIKCLPVACINKDKKRLGTAEKTLEKFFLTKLHPNAILCPLSDVGIKPIFIKEFAALVSSLMDNIENNGSAKNVVAHNIVKVRKWFADYEAAQGIPSKDETVNHVTAPATVTDTKALNNENNRPTETIKSSKLPSTLTAEEATTDMSVYLIDLLSKAGKAAAAVRSEGVQQRNKIETLSQTIESEQDNLRQANQQIATQQDTIAELRRKLSTAEGDIAALKQTVEQRDTIIAEKDAEIAERMKMAEILSRDRDKQADESLQRLASKLKVEYRDFMDALDMPMSCDLGENLRLQLQSIFDILEKGGIKIK